jgi:hypothetical protein
MKTNLKPLMAAAAIAVLFGTPALAASHSQRQVRSPQVSHAAPHSVTAPDGQVTGADPDPGVRSNSVAMRRTTRASTEPANAQFVQERP